MTTQCLLHVWNLDKVNSSQHQYKQPICYALTVMLIFVVDIILPQILLNMYIKCRSITPFVWLHKVIKLLSNVDHNKEVFNKPYANKPYAGSTGVIQLQ